MLLLALIPLIFIYIFCIRNIGMDKRCSSHTLGTVIGLSNLRCGPFLLPQVSYVVNGETYKVVGPKFKGSLSVSKNITLPTIETKFETNLTTRENLPDTLKVKGTIGPFTDQWDTPLTRLYPKGSTADVYYNPHKPKEAFVQRYAGVSSWLVVALAIPTLIVIIIGISLLILGVKG